MKVKAVKVLHDPILKLQHEFFQNYILKNCVLSFEFLGFSSFLFFVNFLQ